MNKFHFKGKSFDTFDELLECYKQWSKLDLNEKTAAETLDSLNKEICLNIFARGVKFSNGEFVKLVEKIFEFFIKELLDYKLD